MSDTEIRLTVERPMPTPRGPRDLRPTIMLAKLLGGVMAVSLLLAATIHYDTSAHADGQVVPAGQNKRVASVEGGPAQEVLVHEGDVVEQGQLLVRLSPAAAESAVGERQGHIDALESRVAMLEAEARGDGTLAELPHADSKAAAEARNRFADDRAALDTQIAALEADVKRAERELGSARASAGTAAEIARQYEAEVSKGGSNGRALEMRQRAQQAQQQVDNLVGTVEADRAKEDAARADAKARARRELSDAVGELAGLKGGAGGAQDRLERTEIRAPVKGVVQSLAVTVKGEVVAPGAVVAEIVPVGDTVVEAKLDPRDRSQVRPGQRALVRLSAFDVSKYGSVEGEIVSISPDVTEDKYHSGHAWYTVRVRTTSDKVAGIETVPGMTASVDVVTGKRTILGYLFEGASNFTARAMREH
jgi:adhesin transport system membrane fusion protein